MLSRMPLGTTDSNREHLDFPNDENTHSSEILATDSDPNLSKVLDYIKNNWNVKKCDVPKDLLPYYNIRDELFVWNKTCLGRVDRSIIQHALPTRVLQKAHGKAHLGIVRLKQHLHYLYWPGIDSDAEHSVKDCFVLQVTKNTRIQPLFWNHVNCQKGFG